MEKEYPKVLEFSHTVIIPEEVLSEAVEKREPIRMYQRKAAKDVGVDIHFKFPFKQMEDSYSVTGQVYYQNIVVMTPEYYKEISEKAWKYDSLDK